MCVDLIIWIEQVRLYLEMHTHTHTPMKGIGAMN